MLSTADSTVRDDPDTLDGRQPHSAAVRTVALAIERVALASLRIALLLTLLAAAGDAVLAAMGGAHAAVVLAGAVMASLALAGLCWPRRAAALLRPRGRIVLVAVAFGLLGLLRPGLHSSYSDVETAIACLAAVLATPAWLTACLIALAAGAVIDPIATGGHSLAWALSGPGGGALTAQLAGICASAALTLGAIGALRRTLAGVATDIDDPRNDAPTTTQQQLAAGGAATTPAGLLARADSHALLDTLSAAERRVLALLADGAAPKQAAHTLGVAVATVRTQIAAAKRKTGARTLEQLVGIYAEGTPGER